MLNSSHFSPFPMDMRRLSLAHLAGNSEEASSDRHASDSLSFSFRLYDTKPEGFVVDTKTSNALLHGLCEEGTLDEALRIREEILGRERGNWKKRLRSWMKWLRGLKPDNHTYIILTRWLFELNKIEEAIQFWGSWKRNVMIDKCCKAERAGEGQNLFDEMMRKERAVKHSWIIYT
ncbi:hypothetical protein HID58_094287 [Brassica napus]|uniref:Uncharacterized protein n=1 Tax=Brassica napus TaxID=3708 RepID=A0ABQ7X7W4_BRANA|nr:hypothetical protein HID58_094287 [Brassica napus]